MSQWTHVAGCIRIDSFPFLDVNIVTELSKSFGNTCQFNDLQYKWDRCNVPCGSEGSVQYRIVRTGDESSLSWGVIYIWGDLRDYSDQQAIHDWLKSACREKMIRSCVVKIDVEYHGSYIIYDDDKSNLIMTKLPSAHDDNIPAHDD